MPNPNRRSAFTKVFSLINLSHIPGPRNGYYLNYVKHFQKNILQAFTRVNSEYGDIASFPWPMNSVIVYSPQMIKTIMVDQGKNFIKGEQIEELRAVVGNGLATNNDYESWLKSRALLSREFNNKSVASFTSDFITILNEQFPSHMSERSLDICEAMKLLTFKIACRTFLGADLNDEDAKKVNAAVHFTSIVTYKRIFQIFPMPYWLPTITNFKFNKHFNHLNSIVMTLIQDERTKHTDNPRSILQKLVHAKDKETNFAFSDNELRDEILTLLIAGHETSAHTLTWCFGLLARHQTIQNKLREELQQQSNCSPEGLLESIPYLKMVLLETMRLYPAFPVLSRKAASNVKIGNYEIPKNTNVVIPIYVMQRSASHWPDSLEFKPERFCEDNADKGYTFLPFGKGHRRCIAELFAMTEMAIIVSEIVKRFKLNLTESELPQDEAFVSLKPVGGLKLRLNPIEA